MKKLILIILTFSLSVFAEYALWDVVDNITWQDSDGGAPVTRDLYDMVDNGKVVVMTWGYLG
ncbi:MAG: hypothetical protein PF638_03885 [Candidatus Delongbacteria bacterium]|jgi:hypothetical protein|nr:hypothetical protein [Candidatus Delongbacteria bacterium]